MRRALALTALVAWAVGGAFRFECVERCVCDTESELVDCHAQNRRRFPDLRDFERLRGFSILSVRQNELTVAELPTERRLLDKFPDLQAIDLEGNPIAECGRLERHFTRVMVLSDCDKKGYNGTARPPRRQWPTGDNNVCDFGCQARAKYLRLRAFVDHAWAVVTKHTGQKAKGVQTWVKNIDLGSIFDK